MRRTADIQSLQPDIAANPVIDMYDQITRIKSARFSNEVFGSTFFTSIDQTVAENILL